jgi:hypothetical protein
LKGWLAGTKRSECWREEWELLEGVPVGFGEGFGGGIWVKEMEDGGHEAE